jgi:hypothetical protein
MLYEEEDTCISRSGSPAICNVCVYVCRDNTCYVENTFYVDRTHSMCMDRPPKSRVRPAGACARGWHQRSLYLLDTPSEKRPFQNLCARMASEITDTNSQKSACVHPVKRGLFRICVRVWYQSMCTRMASKIADTNSQKSFPSCIY